MMQFLKSVLANDNGLGSTHRVCLTLVILLLLAWATRIVVLKTAIPDIPETWVWLIGVLVAGITGQKIPDAYVKGKGTANVVPQQQS